MIRKIRLSFLKLFNKKKYYKAVGEYMAQDLTDACERAAIAFSSFSDALRKVFPDEVAEMEKADKTEE